MRTKGNAKELEQRRLRAIALVEETGLSQREAATRTKVNERTVRKWLNAFRQGGKAAVAARPTPGRPRRLGREAMRKLERVLLKGARASGYSNDLWTARRVAEVVRKECGVVFNSKYIPEVLKSLGWTPQKPQRRAVERDEEEIARWKAVEWTRIKKKAKKTGAKIVFIDESGFLMHPTVVRTWAPRGQTPVLLERGRHYQNTSAIAAIVTTHKFCSARVFFRLHPGVSIKRPQALSFITALTRQLKGPLIIVWDRLNVHRSVATHCHNHRVTFEFLPAYAPELNPTE